MYNLQAHERGKMRNWMYMLPAFFHYAQMPNNNIERIWDVGKYLGTSGDMLRERFEI
jgi:hypothetical protein